MTASGRSQCHVRRGQYLGEISALCFLRLPSSLPLLLAGTGSQVLLYDLLSGKIRRSFQVFEGIRVHGISLEHVDEQLPGLLGYRLAVFGERRVKLFHLQLEPHTLKETTLDMKLNLICSLPKFGHWVLDVSFLKDGATSTEDSSFIGVGCSDNSVYLWNVLRHNMSCKVLCAERCLLYSMRMLGSDIGSLCIASGTIFNEIIVWKVNFHNSTTPIRSHREDCELLANDGDVVLSDFKYKDALICRLVGHEGSIFRIAWFPNGKKLVSVSDDRSARVWEVPAEKEVSCQVPQDGIGQFSGPVLFGHSARIWDCGIFDSIIITAGEDCTCRVWDHNGRELTKIKEHIGRGVWRCLYDPISSLLVTAGFDSAIKVHQLFESSMSLGQTIASEYISDRMEVFSISLPNLSKEGELIDSKSEYVRCLHFSREDSLYVATNNGYLYHASLYNHGTIKWTELWRISEEAPIICMDLISKCPNPASEYEDWIAIGDGKGIMTIIQVVGAGWSRKVEFILTWAAEKERRLLGAYWCKSLENRFIFTVDPGGQLKLWKLCCNLSSDVLIAEGSYDVFLISEYASCFGLRIMCVDASLDDELVVCGDIRGNLLLFSLPRDLLCGMSVAAEVKMSPLSYFKGAHGVSSVSSVSILSLSLDKVQIHSTGADGCICYLKHDRGLLNLEFIGMNQVKELSAIRSVYPTGEYSDNSTFGNYVVGFSSANFIIWNLNSRTKVLQITCGGWRRPHSYYLGEFPEMTSCFSFVKDDFIHIHRHWVPGTDRQLYPRNLHLQFHGREIHSLCFIHEYLTYNSCEHQGLVSESSWIATGCEDGSVRLTRYEPGMENWSSSQYLGEHVGGSAVRSIRSVSKMHVFMPDPVSTSNAVYGQNGAPEDENFSILISVGAKSVVTAWKHMVQMNNQKLDTPHRQANQKNENSLSGSSMAAVPSSSFQWLSTDMPSKHTRYMNKNSTKARGLSTATSDAISIKPSFMKCRNMESCPFLEDNFESDWRYLDVTAFLVKEVGSRVSACFAVVACSDVTVTLRALVLPYRLWFDVALLCSLSSPVLSLQHVVIPKFLPTEGNKQLGNLYLVFAGSTNGSIAIWDLTKCVENFMLQISSILMENCMEFQKRPRTGRGSQGGRWWRSIIAMSKPETCELREDDNSSLVSDGRKSDNKMGKNGVESSEMSGLFHEADHTASVSGETSSHIASEMVELVAVHVLDNVHQSGVNCLCVSDVEDLKLSHSGGLSFYVVSGGDDQAISCIRCDLTGISARDNTQKITLILNSSIPTVNMNSKNHHCLIQNHQLQILFVDKISSAHSSAVKGVWTDGIWVFSVGLDQRIRCWALDHGSLIEHAHLIINVPEPEAFDVKSCGRNRYQIAVAGRGMQMIVFFPKMG